MEWFTVQMDYTFVGTLYLQKSSELMGLMSLEWHVRKLGRRPRDSLSPKAVKCLQGIFAIKDTVTKREAREISALCGATITQHSPLWNTSSSKPDFNPIVIFSSSFCFRMKYLGKLPVTFNHYQFDNS
eukprot:Gb_02139 [translate_table: standard]